MNSLDAQHESLMNADATADENLYSMDKSNRVLRGMSSWSGWFQNLVTKDVKPPEHQNQNQNQNNSSGIHSGACMNANANANAHTKLNLDDAVLNNGRYPREVRMAVNDMNAYHGHVRMLDQILVNSDKSGIWSSAEKQQMELLLPTCHELRIASEKSLIPLKNTSMQPATAVYDRRNVVDIYNWLLEQKSELENLHENAEKRYRMKTNYVNGNGTGSMSKTSLFGTSKSSSDSMSNTPCMNNNPGNSETLRRIKKQEDYLNSVAPDVGDLKAMGLAISASLEQHNTLLDNIERKTDEVDDKMKIVNRKAGRLNQRYMFKREKPTFLSFVKIKFLPTDKYMTVDGSDSSSITLNSRFCGDASIFGMYRNQGDAYGFQNALTKKWLGQNIWGNIACVGNSFSSREEWEINPKTMERTYMLCASACWGNGGWIVASKNPNTKVSSESANQTIMICGDDIESRRSALFWEIKETDVVLTDDKKI